MSTDLPRSGPTLPPAAAADLADFEIFELLGAGGSAVVHRAVHTTLQASVALKRWRGSLTETQRRKFLDECQLQWRLSDHPNIVRLYWVGATADGAPWLAMELYQTSLADRIMHGPKISTGEGLSLAADILEGLAAIHSAHHLHRDIKPGNVLMTNGRAALADLGIAMRADAQTEDNAAGTARFLAPELLHGAAPDYRSDVYSAALSIRTAVSSAPDWLDRLLTRATSHNPADRPADGRALLLDLQHAGERQVRDREQRDTGFRPPRAPVRADSEPRPRPHYGEFVDGNAAPGAPKRKRGMRTRFAVTAGMAVAALAVGSGFVVLSTGRGTARQVAQSSRAAQLRVTSVIAVGLGPVGLAAQPDGRRLYVLLNGLEMGSASTAAGSLAIVDLASHKSARVAVGKFPTNLLIDGGSAYIANSDADTLSVVDTTSRTVITIGVEGGPGPMAMSPDGRHLYVANVGDSSVSALDKAQRTVAPIGIGLPDYPRDIVVAPDGLRAYVSVDGPQKSGIWEIDTASGSITPIVTNGVPGKLAMSPDGNRVYAVNDLSDQPGTVSVVDTGSRSVSTVQVGFHPIALSVAPDGGSVYVLNRPDSGKGSVSIINTSTNSIRSIDVAARPEAMAIAPDGKYVYVVNRPDTGKGSVSVIDTRTLASSEISVGEQPDAIAVAPDGRSVYIANDPPEHAGSIFELRWS